MFAILASTPQKLKQEVANLSAGELMKCPAPNKWSIQIVLAHLDDVEEVGMRSRIAAMLQEKNPVLRRFDQEARVGVMHYARINPHKTLAAFTRKRRANLKWLRTLWPAQLRRKGIHEQVGEVSVEEFLNEWAFHDLGHLKQILEIKRYTLYPRMGNMRAFYRLS